MSYVHRRLKSVLFAFSALAVASFSTASARSVTYEVGATPSAPQADERAAAPEAPSAGDFSARFNAPSPDDPAASAPVLPPDDQPAPADDPLASASDAAAKVIKWIFATHDNGDLPFIVIDKVNADMFVFDPAGQPRAHAPVLVGITKGDDSEPGVGDRELSDIPVWMRTTPAGRFVARFGPAAGHKEPMLWVDLRDAISLHPVVTSNPKEHRLARIKSATASDNRITFGCINVDKALYNSLIEPLFHDAGGVVYVLPEVRPLELVFAGVPPESPELVKPFGEVFASYSADLPQAPAQAESQ